MFLVVTNCVGLLLHSLFVNIRRLSSYHAFHELHCPFYLFDSLFPQFFHVKLTQVNLDALINYDVHFYDFLNGSVFTGFQLVYCSIFVAIQTFSIVNFLLSILLLYYANAKCLGLFLAISQFVFHGSNRTLNLK